MVLPGARLHMKLWRPWALTWAPQRQRCGILKLVTWMNVISTARRKAIALQALYMLQRKLHVCLSVRHTPVLCQNRERREMQSSPSGSPVSSFLVPRMVDGDDIQICFSS